MSLKIVWTLLLVCLQLAVGREFKFNIPKKACLFGSAYGAGGVAAMIGEFPYMYTLGWRAENYSYEYKCGATMIHRRYLLTAAHCLYDSDTSPVVVRWAGRGESDKPYFLYIEDIIEHPDYKYPEAYNDIAIIRIAFNVQTDFARLPTFDPIIGENVTMIGYGSEKYAGPPSKVLLKVDLKVFNNTECRKYFDPELVDSLNPEGIIETHLCAGDPEKIRDACKGDSGGPLLRKHLGVDYIIGITSFGIGCGNGPPGVYTKVSPYVPWIQRNIQTWVNEESAHMFTLSWINATSCRSLSQACTATQISWNFLIIAAHCLYEPHAIPELYRYGALLLTQEKINNYEIEVHDNYEYPYPYDDLALIRMDLLSYFVIPIWSEFKLQNTTLTTINMYNSTRDERLKPNLLKTTLQVVPNEICAQYYEHFPVNFTRGIAQSQLCAEDLEQKWSTRQGYAEGPLIMHIREHNISNPYLVGMLSVGINCKHCPPAVFTRLSEYRDWISSIVWPNMTQWEMANPQIETDDVAEETT